MTEKRTEDEILLEIWYTYGKLSSPELLTCDGQYRGRGLATRKARLNKLLKLDFEELGRTVSREEVGKYFSSAEWLKKLLQTPEKIFGTYLCSDYGDPRANVVLLGGGDSFLFTKEVYETVASWPF